MQQSHVLMFFVCLFVVAAGFFCFVLFFAQKLEIRNFLNPGSFHCLFFYFTSFNIHMHIQTNPACGPFACHLVHSPLNVAESLLNFYEGILASSNSS